MEIEVSVNIYNSLLVNRIASTGNYVQFSFTVGFELHTRCWRLKKILFELKLMKKKKKTK